MHFKFKLGYIINMNWLSISLISVAMFSLVTIIDKRLIVTHFPSASSFNASVGIWNLISGLIVLVFVLPIYGVPSIQAVLISLFAGVLWAGGLSLFFYSLRFEEVSRATSLWMTAPIFSSWVAVSFFGEKLNTMQWFAIASVVIGALMMSFKPVKDGGVKFDRKALLVLSLASFVTGLAFVINKEATNLTDVWTTHGVRNISMGLGLFAFSYKKGVISDAWGALKNFRAMMLFGFAELLLASIAAFLVVVALNMGPASLVATVSSTRPLLVLILGVSMSTKYFNVLGETIDRDSLLVKFVATLVIVSGVSILALA